MSTLPEIEGVTDLTEIGRGGFGVVYRGLETEFHRQVAVKVLMPTLDERTRQRFERERRAMGAVSDHPNIVTVYRGGLTGAQQPFLVMEYLRGGSLADRLRTRGPLDWREAAGIGAKLADALAVSHRAGILHRDVKPGNVFQTESGEPKLGDFGIARLDDGQDSRTGSITASVAHAPPEIVDGQRGDERSDLYSLASTIYALTVGHAPFSGDPDQGLAALLARVSTEPPPGMGLEPAAAEFERTLLRALSKRPEDRQPSVADFGNELRRASLAPVTPPIGQAHPHPQSAPPPAPAGNNPSGPTTSGPTTSGATSAVTTIGATAVGPASPKPATSAGKLALLAVVALAIAGLGGWAIARAVIGGTDDNNAGTRLVDLDEPTAVTEPTAEPPPTLEPTAAPTAVPTLEPTSVPTAVSAAPTATPPPSPTAATGLANGGRGSLGASVDGYTVVDDFSGAISVSVPDAWAETVEDGSTLDLESESLDGVRVLAVGGTLQQLNGEPEGRDLSISGMYVFAARLGPGADSANILDVGLSFWSDCNPGDADTIPVIDGVADYQLVQCDRTDGNSTGVVVLALVPQDDPEVAVSAFVQFANLEDLSSLPTILSTFDIDPAQIPVIDSG